MSPGCPGQGWCRVADSRRSSYLMAIPNGVKPFVVNVYRRKRTDASEATATLNVKKPRGMETANSARRCSARTAVREGGQSLQTRLRSSFSYAPATRSCAGGPVPRPSAS